MDPFQGIEIPLGISFLIALHVTSMVLPEAVQDEFAWSLLVTGVCTLLGVGFGMRD